MVRTDVMDYRGIEFWVDSVNVGGGKENTIKPRKIQEFDNVAGAIDSDADLVFFKASTAGVKNITIGTPTYADLGKLKVINMPQAASGGGSMVLAGANLLVAGSTISTATFSSENATLVLLGVPSKWAVLANIGVAVL